MVEICLSVPEMEGRVWGIASDRQSGSIEVARQLGLKTVMPEPEPADSYNDRLLDLCERNEIDFIVSTGYTRIFKGGIVDAYKGRLLNTHFSLLPGFPGHRRSDWTVEHFPPRAIFERALAYGSRIIGNTVHLIDKSIDGGFPVMQSSVVVPYDEDQAMTRHRLFVQECQCFMQTLVWLSERRLEIDSHGRPRIKDARFTDAVFSPALEHAWIRDFAPALVS